MLWNSFWTASRNMESPTGESDEMIVTPTPLGFSDEPVEGYMVSEDFTDVYTMRFTPESIIKAVNGLDFGIGPVTIEGKPFMALIGKGSIPSMMNQSGDVLVNGPAVLFSRDDTAINGLAELDDDSLDILRKNIMIIRVELDDGQRRLVPCVIADRSEKVTFDE